MSLKLIPSVIYRDGNWSVWTLQCRVYTLLCRGICWVITTFSSYRSAMSNITHTIIRVILISNRVRSHLTSPNSLSPNTIDCKCTDSVTNFALSVVFVS